MIKDSRQIIDATFQISIEGTEIAVTKASVNCTGSSKDRAEFMITGRLSDPAQMADLFAAINKIDERQAK